MQIFFPDCIKLVGYFTSAVNAVSSNPCVGSSPRIKISFPYYQHAQMSSYQLQN